MTASGRLLPVAKSSKRSKANAVSEDRTGSGPGLCCSTDLARGELRFLGRADELAEAAHSR